MLFNFVQAATPAAVKKIFATSSATCTTFATFVFFYSQLGQTTLNFQNQETLCPYGEIFPFRMGIFKIFTDDPASSNSNFVPERERVSPASY